MGYVRIACAAMVLVVTACGDASDVGDEAATEPSLPETTTSSTTTTTTTTTSPTQDGEMTPPPPLVQSIFADLAAREGVATGDIVLISTESVDWPDGSLGCPMPGVSYIQVVTPGYRVTLGIGDDTFDYRATADGSFRLCQNPLAGSSSTNSDS